MLRFPTSSCQINPHDTPRSTHIIVAPLVVLVFALNVDGKLGQEGALEGVDKRRRCEIDVRGDSFVR